MQKISGSNQQRVYRSEVFCRAVRREHNTLKRKCKYSSTHSTTLPIMTFYQFN